MGLDCDYYDDGAYKREVKKATMPGEEQLLNDFMERKINNELMEKKIKALESEIAKAQPEALPFPPRKALTQIIDLLESFPKEQQQRIISAVHRFYDLEVIE